MAFEMPRLRKQLLGYKKPAVERLLVEREEMFSAALKEKGELSARLDEKTRELARLRTELSGFAEEANASRDRSAEQEAQVEAARARVAELEVQQGALEQRLTEQKQLARSSEGRLAVIQAELDSHKEIARIANEGTTRAEQLAAERNEQLMDFRTRMGGLEAEVRAAEQSADAAQRALGEAERRAYEGQVELDTLRHQVASRVHAADEPEQEAKERRDRSAGLEGELERLRVELEQTGSELERARGEANQTNAALQAERRAHLQGGDAPSRDDVAAAFEVAELAIDRIVNENRRRSSEELEALDHRRHEAQWELDRLEARTSRLRTAGSHVGQALRDTRARIDDLEDAIRAALEPLFGSVSALQEGLLELDEPAQEADDESNTTASSPSDEPDRDPEVVESDRVHWLRTSDQWKN